MPAIYMGDTQVTGLNGESAYQIAVAHGYSGTEEEFAQLVVQDSELLNRLGVTNDTESSSVTTGSIFSKLNYLINQTKTYLSNISTYTSRIGVSSDTNETSVFGKLNKISTSSAGGGTQTFTTNGTFTVPNGVTKIWVTACAGGEGGWSEYIITPKYWAKGGQGGDWIVNRAYSVTPGQVLSITIGVGGEYSYGSGKSNKPGGNTVIGSLVTLLGGGVAGNSTGGSGASIYYYSDPGKVIYYDSTDGYASRGITYNHIAGGGGSLGRGGGYFEGTGATANKGTPGFGGGSLGYGDDSDYISPAGNGIVIIEW